MKIKNIYMYAACLVCLVVILFSFYGVISGISQLIWFDRHANSTLYLYQSLFNNAIMFLLATGLFIFHWRHADK